MPAELLLPWRAAASKLGGTKYLGSIELPNGSDNRIFVRPDGQAVMVVWNDTPTQEILYLGKDVHVVDLWGRTTSPTQQDNQQVIDVGPLPTFVTGLSEPIARWRMALRFDQDHIESIFEVHRRTKSTSRIASARALAARSRSSLRKPALTVESRNGCLESPRPGDGSLVD